VPFTPLYHPKVTEEDLPELPVNVQRRIAQTIEARLMTNPEHGSPLRRT
jgi:hypothetical protein